MAFLFGRSKPRSNAELCRSLRELLQRFENEEKPAPKFDMDLSHILAQMKITLQGTNEIEVSPPQVHQLVECLIREDVLLSLARNIRKYPFESRKDVQIIFSQLFRYKPESAAVEDDPLVVQHVFRDRPQIVTALCNGYNERDGAMQSGGALREALKHQTMTALILYDEPSKGGPPAGLKGVDQQAPATGQGIFWKFFAWIQQGAFDASADAFSTFREILTKHKRLIAPFLITNHDLFVSQYHTHLMQSTNYVTKRTSIQLLASILLERPNYNFMTAYVASPDNLKLTMRLLRDDHRMVKYEAFHIFKVFVANPNKSPGVTRILIMNRDKLLRFLPTFLEDRGKEDDQLAEERAYLVRVIEQLPATAPPAAPAGDSGAQPGPVLSGMGTHSQVDGMKRLGSFFFFCTHRLAARC